MHLLDIHSGSRKWMAETMYIKVICLHEQMEDGSLKIMSVKLEKDSKM